VDHQAELPRHLRPDRTFDDVRLDPWHRWPMLAGLVTVFLLGGGKPVWNDPFDIDAAIWLSYALIPPLVVACLFWSRRLSWATAFLNTLEITILKFTFTYLIAMPLWAIIGPPPRPRLHDSISMTKSSSAPPEVTPWPDASRGAVRGMLRDAAGQPLAGAWIYVAAGLEDYVPPWPAEEAMLGVGAQGFREPVFHARRWQPLRGRSEDGRLHTVFFERDGHVLGNVPLLPSGEPSTLPTFEADGVVSLRCAVHGERAHMLFLHHPYAAETDGDGRFALEGVPALAVTVAAWHPLGEASAPAAVLRGGTVDLDLRLSP
jgi:hypothetical protein